MKKLFIALIFLPITSQAYYTVFDTASTLENGTSKAGVEAQYILNKIAGAQFIGHYSYGLAKGREVQISLGAGTVNMELAAFYKYVPIPDLKDQPGIGGSIGIVYANKDGAYALSALFRPFISKQFFIDSKSYVTPYLAIPIGVAMGSTASTLPTQFVFGAEWQPDFMTARIVGEMGFEVNSSFSYYSAGLSFPL